MDVNNFSYVNFTVLMAFYQNDNPELFDRAINSVFENSISPSEFILVQDGPVPFELSRIINKYSHKSILKHLVLEKNCGLAKALNFGLDHVSYDYVFRADADDFNLPDRFEKQISMLMKGQDLVGGFIEEVDEFGKVNGIRTVPVTQRKIEQFLVRRNPFNHMTVAFRTEFVRECGGYPDIYLKEDYALWVKMISSGAKVANVNDVLVLVTAGNGMYRRRGGIKYIKSEILLQSHLVNCGSNNVLDAVLIGSIRSLVFLMPSYLRGFIYEKFLRKKSN